MAQRTTCTLQPNRGPVGQQRAQSTAEHASHVPAAGAAWAIWLVNALTDSGSCVFMW
jgi:hypothetical protein